MFIVKTVACSNTAKITFDASHQKINEQFTHLEPQVFHIQDLLKKLSTLEGDNLESAIVRIGHALNELETQCLDSKEWNYVNIKVKHSVPNSLENKILEIFKELRTGQR